MKRTILLLSALVLLLAQHRVEGRRSSTWDGGGSRILRTCCSARFVGTAAAFTTGWLQLFQVVFTPVESAPPFWTRAELYEQPLIRS